MEIITEILFGIATVCTGTLIGMLFKFFYDFALGGFENRRRNGKR